MYHYEQLLNEHRQRVARGVQNYERRRVAAVRGAESIVGESDSDSFDSAKTSASNDRESESETRE